MSAVSGGLGVLKNTGSDSFRNVVPLTEPGVEAVPQTALHKEELVS